MCIYIKACNILYIYIHTIYDVYIYIYVNITFKMYAIRKYEQVSQCHKIYGKMLKEGNRVQKKLLR